MEYFCHQFKKVNFTCVRCPIEPARNLTDILRHILACDHIVPFGCLACGIEEGVCQDIEAHVFGKSVGTQKTLKFNLDDVVKFFEILEDGIKWGADVASYQIEDFEFVDGQTKFRDTNLFPVFMNCAKRAVDGLFTCSLCEFAAEDDDCLKGHFTECHPGTRTSFVIGKEGSSFLKYLKLLDELDLLISYSNFSYANREELNQERIKSRSEHWRDEMEVMELKRWNLITDTVMAKNMSRDLLYEGLLHFFNIPSRVTKWIEPSSGSSNSTENDMRKLVDSLMDASLDNEVVEPAEESTGGQGENDYAMEESPKQISTETTIQGPAASKSLSNPLSVFAVNAEHSYAAVVEDHEPEVPSADENRIEMEDQLMEEAVQYDVAVKLQARGSNNNDNSEVGRLDQTARTTTIEPPRAKTVSILERMRRGIDVGTKSKVTPLKQTDEVLDNDRASSTGSAQLHVSFEGNNFDEDDLVPKHKAAPVADDEDEGFPPSPDFVFDGRSASVSANYSADVAREPQVTSTDDDQMENEDQTMEGEDRYDDSVMLVVTQAAGTDKNANMSSANDEVMEVDTSSLDSPQLTLPEAAEPDMNEHVNALAEQARSNNSEPFEDGNTSANDAADFDMEEDRESVSTDQNQDEYEDDMMDEEIHFDDSPRLTVTQTDGNGINDNVIANVLVEPAGSSNNIPDVMEVSRAAPSVNNPVEIAKEEDHETDESSADEMEVEADEEPSKRVIMTRQAARAARVLVEPVRIPDVIEVSRAAPSVNNPVEVAKEEDHETDESSADEMEVETDEEPLKRVIMPRQAARAARVLVEPVRIPDVIEVSRAAPSVNNPVEVAKEEDHETDESSADEMEVETDEEPSKRVIMPRQAARAARSNAESSLRHQAVVTRSAARAARISRSVKDLAVQAPGVATRRRVTVTGAVKTRNTRPARHHVGLPSLLFTCLERNCKYSFDRFDDVKAHMRDQHHSGSDFFCNVCKNTFSTEALAEAHLQTRISMKCCDCGRKLEGSSRMIHHLRTHSKEQPHKCDVCGKLFKRPQNLESHYRDIHSGQKEFVCDVAGCTKRFALKHRLRAHQRFHNELRPFSCDCGVTFKYNESLNRHRRLIHTKEKRYSCRQAGCKMAFANQETCKKHFLLVHSGATPHQCNLCHAKFLNGSCLKKHMLTHSDERTHVCVVCRKEYKEKSSLTRHQKKHHTV